MSTNVYNDILNGARTSGVGTSSPGGSNAGASGARASKPLTPQLTVIEPIKREQGPIKVAAYCRVSTDMELQQNSLDTQIEAYTRIINEHPGWELSGIYADKGISGTLVRRRTEFLRMIEDAKAGKINYIIAKSISRFSRNTVDALAYIRLLRDLGVSVYFEKEHLDTGATTSELILSILAATAQEEILTISTNLKMGRRMRAEAGLAMWTPTYGYRLERVQAEGKYAEREAERWVIQEDEAQVVKRIFQEFIEGWSTTEISKHLNDDGVPTARGYGKWASMTVSRILTSEKYLGDVMILKYYVKDPIQHVRVRNKGIVKQYYIRDHHPAIVDRETAEIAKKVAVLRDNHNGTTQYPFYGLLKCPLCGANMVRVPVFLHNRYYVWTCGGKTPDGKTPDGKAGKTGLTRAERTQCPPYLVDEDGLIKALCTAAEDAGKGITRDVAVEANTQSSARRSSRVGSRKYGILNYRKLIAEVNSITIVPWDQVKVTWTNGESTASMLTRNKRRIPNPVTEPKVEEGGHVFTPKAIHDIQNAIIEDGELVPKVYGCGSKRFMDREQDKTEEGQPGGAAAAQQVHSA